MQQFERELQYKCGSVSGMGNSTESSNVVDGGQQAKHQQHRNQHQDLAVHGVSVLLEHTPCYEGVLRFCVVGVASGVL